MIKFLLLCKKEVIWGGYDRESKTIQGKIAMQILRYIDGKEGNSLRYIFNQDYNDTDHGNNLHAEYPKGGETVTQYLGKSKHQATISIFFTADGKIDLIQFGTGEYLVFMNNDTHKVEKNGKTLLIT